MFIHKYTENAENSRRRKRVKKKIGGGLRVNIDNMFHIVRLTFALSCVFVLKQSRHSLVNV